MSSATVLAGSINSSFRWEVIEELEIILSRVRELHDRPRHGGYFVIADGTTGLPLVVAMLGAPELSKANQYFANACEKAQRLASHPEHYLSWQSRVEDYKFAGAVRVGCLIFSFSGLPEMLDEALMLALGARTHQIRHADALVRAQTSGNEELFNKVWAVVEHD
jgi:hypothetical protein